MDKEEKIEDPGLLTIGTYLHYPITKHGKLTIGFYGVTPPTVQGVLIIGQYQSFICTNPNIVLS